jgi:hypothetical protein
MKTIIFSLLILLVGVQVHGSAAVPKKFLEASDKDAQCKAMEAYRKNLRQSTDQTGLNDSGSMLVQALRQHCAAKVCIFLGDPKCFNGSYVEPALPVELFKKCIIDATQRLITDIPRLHLEEIAQTLKKN